MSKEKGNSYGATETVDSIARYLEEISAIPRITPEQELILGRRVQRGMAAAAETQQSTTLSPERSAYLRRVIHIGTDAEDFLVNSNLRLVVDVAKHYVKPHLSLLDLVQEGNLGLREAAHKYDPDRGNVFSTVAVWWIRKQITLAIPEIDRPIPIKKSQHDLNRKIRRFQNTINEKEHRNPTTVEIAKALGNKHKRTIINNLIDFQHQKSLHDPISTIDGDDGDELMDRISDNGRDNPLTLITNAEDQKLLSQALTQLTPLQREIISRRFWYSGQKKPTQEEVGQHLGILRNQVSIIERETLRQLADYINGNVKIEDERDEPAVPKKKKRLTHTMLVSPSDVRTHVYTIFCSHDQMLKFTRVLKDALQQKYISDDDYNYVRLFFGLDNNQPLSANRIAQQLKIGYSRAQKNLVFAISAAHKALATNHATDPDIAHFLLAITKSEHTVSSLHLDP